MNKKLLLVGNKLIHFLKNSQVKSISFISDSSNEVHIGQGLSNKEMLRLKKKGLIVTNNLLVKENKKNVHKRLQKNVMISKPEKFSEQEYSAYLMVDDDCAEMSDHLTGQHLQGMLVIEAARQMMLSVTENYLLSDLARYKSWIILGAINTKFYGFLFPLSTKIKFEITDKFTKSSKLTINSKITFYQNEKLQAAVTIEYCVYSRKTLTRIESKMARQALIANFEK